MINYNIKKVEDVSGITETSFVNFTDVIVPKSGGTFTGLVIAPSFSGDGSNLTGITADPHTHVSSGITDFSAATLAIAEKISDNTVIINTLSDLPTAAGGKHTLAASTAYIINASIVIGGNYIELGNNTILRGSSSFVSQIIYTGTGGAIRGTDITSSISNITFIANNGSGKVFDMINTGKTKTFVIQECIIASSTLAGTVNGFDVVFTSIINHIGNSNGWIFSNVKHLFVLDNYFASSNSGTNITVSNGDSHDVIINRCLMHLSSGVGIDISESGTTYSALTLTSNVIHGSGTLYQNFNPLNGNIVSQANVGIPNDLELTPVDSSVIFNITNPQTGQVLFLTDLLANAIWNGTFWQYPDGTKISKTLFNENFESGTFTTNSWVTVAGGENDWYVGTAAQFDGTYGAYISNTAGSTNAYGSIGGALDVSHVYIDITLPAATIEMNLSFDWRCEAEVNYDVMRVFNAPTSITPVANTEVSLTYLIGLSQYNNQSTWTSESISIPLGQASTTRRFIFSWRNDSSVENQPPAAIDNIKITWL